MLLHLDAHEQAAVGAALNAQMRRGCDATGDEILADGSKVVVDALAIDVQTGLMPGGPKFATAANVGQHIHVAWLEPKPAHGGRIARRFGNFESAIGRE